MRRHARRLERALSFAAVALLPACGALLDLPDPTLDSGVGVTGDSGFYPDGAPIGDGAAGDGSQNGDGSQGGDGSSGDAGADTGTLDCVTTVCPLTTDIGDPSGIANDGAYLYVINGNSEIDRVDGSGNHVALVTGETNLTSQIAVAGGNVYFVNEGSSSVNGMISSCSTTNGCTGLGNRINFLSSKHAFFGIATDGTNVYFTANESTAAGGGMYICSISGGAGCAGTRQLSLDQAYRIDVDSSRLFMNDTTATRNGVFECPAGSCTSATDSVANSVTAFAIDATYDYWTTDSQVSYHARGTMNSPLPLGASDTSNVDIGVDGSGNVYWVDSHNSGANGVLYRCANAAATGGCTGGTSPVNLDGTLNDAKQLTIMGSYVYVTSLGMITRVDK